MMRCRRCGRDSSDETAVSVPSYLSIPRDNYTNKPLSPFNPWKRRRPRFFRNDLVMRGTTENKRRCSFGCYNVNKDLDVYTKRAVLKVSPSVVALISYSEGTKVFWGSGVIFECTQKENSIYCSVLTSATLLRPPCSDACDDRASFDLPDTPEPINPEHDQHLLAEEKIDVYLQGGTVCEGEIVFSDPHYNITVLTFKSDILLPCAVLRPLDDSFVFNNGPTTTQHCAPLHQPFKLVSGDAVIAVGRFTHPTFQIMAAPGKFRAGRFYKDDKLNCLELFRADCKVTKCGIGGPLINSEGEVIGINFYAEHSTPFLPVNIFLNLLSYYRVTLSICRPWLGMGVASLYSAADLGFLEEAQNLGISQGLLVEKVFPGSPAEISGICSGDVIIECSNTRAVTPLKLFEMMWDSAGKSLEVEVLRKGSRKNMKLEVKDITAKHEFYRWPLPRAYSNWNFPYEA